MRRSRWTIAGGIAVLLVVGSWSVVSRRVAQAQTTKPTAVLLKQQIEQQQIFLDQQERKRLEILNQLEFAPRPSIPLPGPPFPKLCLIPPKTPAAAIDPHRSLFVHDRGTLDGADFTLQRTLSQIASQVVPVVPGTTPVTIFRQFWDTQNAAPGVTSGPHCTDNGSTINGFPITCPRNEGSEAVGSDADLQSRIKEYRVLALVNRIDLAHQGWRNCGEHRIIYGKEAAGRNLIIFEAVLPNPKPGCREGCVPVAEFWKSLSSINNPVTRANQLATFYYNGLPGFRPVVHVDHYSAAGVTTGYGSSGSGQIRTNQFLQTGPFQPWLLKEFKTVIDCGIAPCTFNIVPIMVKVNPHGPLWNEDDPHPLGPAFRAATVAQLPRLSDSALLRIGYEVSLDHDAGQSMSLPGPGFVDDYRDQMNSAVAVGFRAALGAGALTADQIANRAITQSCAGCHQPATFGLDVPGSIGTVTTPVGSPVPTVDLWPPPVPARFIHVDIPPSPRPELIANPAAFPGGLGQEISPALLDFFLPERKNFLLGQLNAKRCPCVNRFVFLAPALRGKALEIEAKINRQFAERLETLERRSIEAELAPVAERERASGRLIEARNELLAERNRALVAELGRGGITLPEAEMLDLKPRTLKLTAASEAGDARRAAALRVKKVLDLLRQEPPRRTVTGSFRVH